MLQEGHAPLGVCERQRERQRQRQRQRQRESGIYLCINSFGEYTIAYMHTEMYLFMWVHVRELSALASDEQVPPHSDKQSRHTSTFELAQTLTGADSQDPCRWLMPELSDVC